jgi:hypothetical protein
MKVPGDRITGISETESRYSDIGPIGNEVSIPPDHVALDGTMSVGKIAPRLAKGNRYVIHPVGHPIESWI